MEARVGLVERDQDPIDVADLQAGVLDRAVRRLHLELQGRLVRDLARELGRRYSHDGDSLLAGHWIFLLSLGPAQAWMCWRPSASRSWRMTAARSIFPDPVIGRLSTTR